MSCFLIPRGIIVLVEGAIRRFWWGGKNGRYMSWVAWQQLCRDKEFGGMGCRDLHFNLALLAKQGWCIIMNPKSLISKLYKARYFPDGDFFTTPIGSRPSATWRAIWTARPYLVQGIRTWIGDGTTTSIWHDAWLNEDNSFRILTTIPTDNQAPKLVSELLDPYSRTWCSAKLQQWFWEVDRERIRRVAVGGMEAPDRKVWHYTKNGMFSVKSCYHLIMNMNSSSSSAPTVSGFAGATVEGKWQWLWWLVLPPKVKMFLWRACCNSLPTQVELFRPKVVPSLICPRCHEL